MPKHLADRFNRHTDRQRYRCRKGVAGEVEGQSFCGYYFIDISLVISSALALVIL